MNRNRLVVVAVSDVADRRMITEVLHPHVVVQCAHSPEDLVLHMKVAAAVVYEPGALFCDEASLILEARKAGTRIVLRMSPTAVAVRRGIAVISRHRDAAVSLRGCGVAELAELLRETDGGPSAAVLGYLATKTHADTLLFLTCALALGQTRVTTTEYARVCKQALRTLEDHHKRYGLPVPKRLLLWCQAVWFAWRCEYWGMNVKQAASAGGFVGAGSFGAAMGHIGVLPSKILSAGGVAGVVDRMLTEICGARVPPAELGDAS